MKKIASSLFLCLFIGCTHTPDSKPAPLKATPDGVTDSQLAGFRDRALKILRFPEEAFPRGTVVPALNGTYDAARPIRCWMTPGTKPSVVVHIPTKAESTEVRTFVEMEFDSYSGAFVTAWSGIMPP